MWLGPQELGPAHRVGGGEAVVPLRGGGSWQLCRPLLVQGWGVLPSGLCKEVRQGYSDLPLRMPELLPCTGTRCRLHRPASAGLLGKRVRRSHGKGKCKGSEVGLLALLKPQGQETVFRTMFISGFWRKMPLEFKPGKS